LKRKLLMLGLVMVALTLGVSLADQFKIVSNIYTSETTEVSDPQLMDVWIDEAAKPPETMLTGQPFTVLVTVNNTNAVTLKAFVMLNVTSDHAISHGVDVEVWPVEGLSVTLGSSSDPNTIVYHLWSGGSQYLTLAPGLNAQVTGIIIQYNKAGNYTISVGVYQ